VRDSGLEAPPTWYARDVIARLARPVVACVAVALSMSSARPATSGTGKPEARDVLQIRADHAELDVENGTAILEGHVEARAGELRLRSERAELHYAEDDQIQRASATGAVVVDLAALHAEAPQVELRLDTRLATFPAGVRVRRGKSWASARTASIHLDTRKIVMKGVEGAFPVDGRR